MPQSKRPVRGFRYIFPPLPAENGKQLATKYGMWGWLKKTLSREEEVKQMLAKAEAGDANAQFRIAVWHIEGKMGTEEPDTMQAAQWFRRAADQGHRDAQYNLGVLYSAGKGVPKDYPLALKWLRIAAEQNCADSQFLLGKFLARGKAGKAGEIESYRWLELAAEQGHEEAKQLISSLKPQVQAVGVA